MTAARDSWSPIPTGGRSLRHRAVYLRDLLRELVVRDMKIRYERSVLGIVWALVNPLAQLLVFVIIFSHVIRLDIPNYPLFVFTGVLAWNWTREALLRAANAITGNRDLIRQPGFPLSLLPVVSLATPLIDLLVALPILVLFVALGGGALSPALLALPLVIALQFLVLQGFGYLLAASQVMFRDTSHLLGVALMLGFYLTPVFYDVGEVPASFGLIYAVNPMAHLLTAYRAILMQGELPDAQALLVLGLVGAVLCAVGRSVFQRASHRFAEEL
jgi:lipopolysaccharide transport system permease protein